VAIIIESDLKCFAVTILVGHCTPEPLYRCPGTLGTTCGAAASLGHDQEINRNNDIKKNIAVINVTATTAKRNSSQNFQPYSIV